MNKHQYIAIIVSFIFLMILLFGFEKKPAKQLLIEKSRVENFENTSIDLLLGEALNSVEPSTRLFLEKKIQLAGNVDSANIEDLIDLSGEWYKLGKYAMAGYYAEKIADRKNDEESWSIAGTTYAAGVQSFSNEKEKEFCANRAIKALEKAFSMNPSKLGHKINLAICYADHPPAENPMKGILMLIDINKENPDNVSTLLALGRLAIQTGQYDRAQVRLEKVVELLPENTQAYCYLAEVYKNLGETKKEMLALNKCN